MVLHAIYIWVCENVRREEQIDDIQSNCWDTLLNNDSHLASSGAYIIKKTYNRGFLYIFVEKIIQCKDP